MIFTAEGRLTTGQEKGRNRRRNKKDGFEWHSKINNNILEEKQSLPVEKE